MGAEVWLREEARAPGDAVEEGLGVGGLHCNFEIVVFNGLGMVVVIELVRANHTFRWDVLRCEIV